MAMFRAWPAWIIARLALNGARDKGAKQRRVPGRSFG
jgi:hypothetical protein